MSKKQLFDTAKKQETAILIGMINQHQDEKKLKEYMDELAFLTETAGAIPVKRFTQKMDKPDSATFLGSGKINEIKNYIKENEINIAIFDDELSPSQLRNLEKETGKKIMDRSDLIAIGYL